MLDRFSPIAAILACLAVAGCVVVPVTVEGYDGRCQVVTHHMELQAVQVAEINHCSGQSCAGMVLVGAGLAAASAVVSGSIVLIGNMVYWAERRADCLVASMPAPAIVPTAEIASQQPR
jgi:hypothetical protein